MSYNTENVLLFILHNKLFAKFSAQFGNAITAINQGNSNLGGYERYTNAAYIKK
jgi:hypothetical protein